MTRKLMIVSFVMAGIAAVLMMVYLLQIMVSMPTPGLTFSGAIAQLGSSLFISVFFAAIVGGYISAYKFLGRTAQRLFSGWLIFGTLWFWLVVWLTKVQFALYVAPFTFVFYTIQFFRGKLPA